MILSLCLIYITYIHCGSAFLASKTLFGRHLSTRSLCRLLICNFDQFLLYPVLILLIIVLLILYSIPAFIVLLYYVLFCAATWRNK